MHLPPIPFAACRTFLGSAIFSFAASRRSTSPSAFGSCPVSQPFFLPAYRRLGRVQHHCHGVHVLLRLGVQPGQVHATSSAIGTCPASRSWRSCSTAPRGSTSLSATGTCPMSRSWILMFSLLLALLAFVFGEFGFFTATMGYACCILWKVVDAKF